MKHNSLTGVLLSILLFNGCASDISHTPNVVSKPEPLVPHGSQTSYIVNGIRYNTLPTSRGYRERGQAYWYEGKITSSGEPYDRFAMTAAHRTLPLPTYVEVTNLRSHRSVIVRINDRGPFNGNRLIDLSYAAADKLGILGHGTSQVEVRAIDTGDSKDRNTNNSGETGDQSVQIRSAAALVAGQDTFITGTLKLPKAEPIPGKLQKPEATPPPLHAITPKPKETEPVASPAASPPQTAGTLTVLSGPTARATGTCSANTDCTTDANGHVSFTHTAVGGVGTDQINACSTDAKSNEGCSLEVTKNRGTPQNEDPDCSQVQPSLDWIWPPNHKFVAISVLGVTDPDGDPTVITIDSIYQDEPVDTYGDGNFIPDGEIIGAGTAKVRAERGGTRNVPGKGRFYHIGYTADDGRGGSCSGEVTVAVPHNLVTVPVDDGALYDSTVP